MWTTVIHHCLADTDSLRQRFSAREIEAEQRSLAELSGRAGHSNPGCHTRALARLSAKDLILHQLRRKQGAAGEPSDLEIRSRAANRGTSPDIFRHGRRLPWSLSISHAGEWVLAALSTLPGVAVGADVVADTVIGRGFERIWFTPREQRWVHAAEDPHRPAVVWAIKEAAYKALNCGEPFAPLSVEALPQSEDRFAVRWQGTEWPGPLHVRVEFGAQAVGAVVAARWPYRMLAQCSAGPHGEDENRFVHSGWSAIT